ncbi:endothelial PAS domain-containing protein 1 [Lampris incognitus]|uniref:endothelial PAS domain-containing protein 1 n=1 Tax=Lampris incognitus TaxID=2546036 RepID=UPI0024B5682D|nr:endothelial PAS domain-containing protein 1 [Lampris incognitus]
MTADREKRRAISREAARRRRRVESDVFSDLVHLLPLQSSPQTQLDKPSIIRLTISYIRTRTLLTGIAGMHREASQRTNYRQMLDAGEEDLYLEKGENRGQKHKAEKVKEGVEALGLTEETDLYLRTLEGFLMVVSADGDIIFLSDNVRTYMGLTEAELMGCNIYEFTHPCDHEEIKNNLCLSAGCYWRGDKRDFVMRMCSTLTQTGRTTNLKSATWKVLRCQGRVKVCVPPSSPSCLLLTCQPLPLSHRLLSTHTFTSQHSLDMRFTHCDHRVTVLLGYSPVELLGRSLYVLCHTQDANCLSKSHVDLCSKSQSVSGQYRMLVRGGGYVWVETHSAIISTAPRSKFNPRVQQSLCVLCVTYVLSGVEEPCLQLSVEQYV